MTTKRKPTTPPKTKGRNNNKLSCKCGFKANLSAKWVNKIRDMWGDDSDILTCPACDEETMSIIQTETE